MADIHSNSANSEALIRMVDAEVTRAHGDQTSGRCDRAQAAAANIIGSSYAIDSATILHCREGAWAPLFAASLMNRIAGNTARGNSQVVTRWQRS